MEVFCTSPWIPVEWIKAHGLEPRGIWSAGFGPRGAVAGGVCAFAQQLVDFSEAHPEAAVIFTSACDQIRRAADAVAGDSPGAFLFNLPATWQTPAARRRYQVEVERLGGFLVRLGGRVPSAGHLETILADSDQRRQQLRERLADAAGRAAAEMLLGFFFDGTVPDCAPAAHSSGVPLALVGGPLVRSQLELFDAVASAGGRVVLNATEPGERCLLPPGPRCGEGRAPMTALADHYFDQAVDVFHRPNSRLYGWLGARLTERSVRGLVLWVHVGCDLWRAEAASLREAFGLPLLVLDEHEGRGVSPRDLTRLCAFVESLR